MPLVLEFFRFGLRREARGGRQHGPHQAGGGVGRLVQRQSVDQREGESEDVVAVVGHSAGVYRTQRELAREGEGSSQSGAECSPDSGSARDWLIAHAGVWYTGDRRSAGERRGLSFCGTPIFFEKKYEGGGGAWGGGMGGGTVCRVVIRLIFERRSAGAGAAKARGRFHYPKRDYPSNIALRNRSSQLVGLGLLLRASISTS